MKANTSAEGQGLSKITDGVVLNKEGAVAYALKDKEKLVTGILTNFFKEPKFYGDNTPEIIETARKIIQEDPEFVAKAACFARNKFHMRSISHALSAEVARGAKGNKIVRKMIRKVIERADDMTNIISYHINTWGKRGKENPIPRGLRRGLADVFPRFDEYALAKYKGESKTVKLRDVLKMIHPTPKNKEQGEMWKRLIEGTLATPETRETILSDKGQSKEVWESILDGKAGYMMILRNLKNILEHGIDDTHLDKVCSLLKDPDEVRSSKQLPFRFLSAYRMVQDMGNPRGAKVLETLEDALLTSTENVQKLKGITAVLTDESGSMTRLLSKNSLVRYRDVGNLLAAISHRICDSSVIVPFGTDAVVLTLSPRSSVFDNMKRMNSSGVGHSTNVHIALGKAFSVNVKIDRIILFSDMQAYGCSDGINSMVQNYRRDKNSNLWVHSVDLAGYGTTQLTDKVNLIAGWSEKILDYIGLVENRGLSLVEDIENYKL
jgi:hypothetical protein